jgi:TolA-binding protein
MNTRGWVLLAAGCLLWLTVGCVTAKAPERIDVRLGSSQRPEPVDSSRVPDPQTLEAARAELHKAYQQIRWLESEVADLEEDKAECKRERNRYKKERDKCEDRLEEYEDD